MFLRQLVLLLAFVILVNAQIKKICLYSNGTVLQPLQLQNSNCPANTSYCMNTIYKYGESKYNGPASLKPRQGEIVMFLSQDQTGLLDFVTFLNANVSTVVNSTVQITGATPTPALLLDDPSDPGYWDKNTNFGTFQWNTLPTYTDGIIVGHINFIDQYCLITSYTPKTVGAINTISIFSGTVASPTRIVTLPFTSGQSFQFCQYPGADSTVTNVACHGQSTGSASIMVTYGPPQANYTWTNPSGTVISNTNSIQNVPAGNYTITLDSFGCGFTRPIFITEPPMVGFSISTTAVNLTSYGTASIVNPVGSAPLTYAWHNGTSTGPVLSTTTSVSGLRLGINYTVCATDSCSNQVCQTFMVPSAGFCGDRICNATLNEDCISCASDCAKPCDVGVCGDGTCITGENCLNCTADCANPCGLCGDGTCSAGVGENCLTCTADCASPCGLCGDGTCSAGVGENCLTCTADCASPCGVCGDGTCSGTENCTNCASDCGACPLNTCRAGFYYNGVTCVICPPGSYNTVTNATSCIQCGANTFSNGGNTPCAACSVSYTSTPGSGKCWPCPVGTARAAAATSCSTCPTGTSHCGGTTTCEACPAGTASNQTGVTSCAGCSPGYFQNLAGQTSCKICPANTYSPLFASSCTACPSGKKSPAGSTTVIACV